MIPMENDNDSTGSSIVLFTSRHSSKKSERLKQSLLRSGCPISEKVATNDDLMELKERFGPDLTLPGLTVDGNLWIPGDSESLDHLVKEYVADRFLQQEPSAGSSTAVTVGEHRREITLLPHMQPTMAKVRDNPYSSPNDILAGRSSKANAAPNSAYEKYTYRKARSGKFTRPGKQKVQIPGSSTVKITVADLTRKLLAATPHYRHHSGATKNVNPVAASTQLLRYSFRGSEGIAIWSELFGLQREEAIQFGFSLMERGILHNYTPLCSNFDLTYLVLQPLKEARSLNTFLQWPTERRNMNEEDPMEILLRLSRIMDATCSQKSGAKSLNQHPLFLEFEQAVCELQVVSMPDEPLSKVTFALNLYNLIVRHAAILTTSTDASWTWPESLAQMESFFTNIGYNVGGEWVSIQDLRMCLFGQDEPPQIVTLLRGEQTKKRWKMSFSCMDASAVAGFDSGTQNAYEVFYEAPVVETDVRLLMAMTSGTQSSPEACTIYPNLLEESLQTAAELYCRKHVIIKEHGLVVLPALLSWYRKDFGETNEDVVRGIKDFLSNEQKQQIRESYRSGELEIIFGSIDASEWKSCLQSKTHTDVGVHTSKMPMAAPLTPSPQNDSIRSHPPKPPKRISKALEIQSCAIADLQWDGSERCERNGVTCGNSLELSSATELNGGQSCTTDGATCGDSLGFKSTTHSNGEETNTTNRAIICGGSSAGSHRGHSFRKSIAVPPARKELDIQMEYEPSTSSTNTETSEELDACYAETVMEALPSDLVSCITFGSEFDILIDGRDDRSVLARIPRWQRITL